MREFAHPNLTNFTCPICKTSKDCPVVLVGIPGTESGGNIKCVQVHAECYRVVAKIGRMRFKTTGTIQVFITTEFEDDGTSIGDQAHRALMHEAMAQGMYGAEFINFEFDRIEEGK